MRHRSRARACSHGGEQVRVSAAAQGQPGAGGRDKSGGFIDNKGNVGSNK